MQAVLAYITSITLVMVAHVAAAAWMFKVCSGVDGLGFHGQQGLNAQVVQQGEGLSTLILENPPMATTFFQGLLGNFSAYIGMVGQFALVLPKSRVALE